MDPGKKLDALMAALSCHVWIAARHTGGAEGPGRLLAVAHGGRLSPDREDQRREATVQRRVQQGRLPN